MGVQRGPRYHLWLPGQHLVLPRIRPALCLRLALRRRKGLQGSQDVSPPGAALVAGAALAAALAAIAAIAAIAAAIAAIAAASLAAASLAANPLVSCNRLDGHHDIFPAFH